uniref:Uncharacterized protein n=1 Tax=Ditylenchus dipsaci TaxID=166011 RepID=A0A915D608_9BILA
MSSYNDFHENIFWCMLVLLSSMCVCPILVSVCLTPLYSALTVSLSLAKSSQMKIVGFSYPFKPSFEAPYFRPEMLYHFIDLDGVVTTASALSMVPKISGGLLTLFSIAVMLLSLGNLMMRMILMVNSMREHFPLLQEKFYLHVAINAICVIGCLLNIGYYVRFGPRVYYAIVTVFLPMLCASVAMYESLTIAYCYGSKKCSLTFKQCFFGKESEDGIVVKTRRTGLWRLLPYFNGYMMICAAVRKMVENSHFTNKNTFMVFIVLVVFAILVIPAYCLIRVVMRNFKGSPSQCFFVLT